MGLSKFHVSLSHFLSLNDNNDRSDNDKYGTVTIFSVICIEGKGDQPYLGPKQSLLWLSCQMPGGMESVLRLVGPVSIFCNWE